MAIRNLKIGCSGSDVRKLQQQLQSLGYYTGAIDGDFGSVTDSAVKAFQRASGLVIDGIYGPATSAVLNARLKKKSSSVVKAAAKKTGSNAGTREIGRWNGHKFVLSPTLIRGFTGLQIKGSCELQDKENSAQGAVSRKGANPAELTLTVQLNAFVGCSVRDEAIAFVTEAQAGKSDYFYVGSKKLVSCKLMLTDASVTEVEMAGNGTWTNAAVALTMKQCDSGTWANTASTSTPASTSASSSSYSSGTYSGSGSYASNTTWSSGWASSSQGSQKISVKSTPVTSTGTSQWAQTIKSSVQSGVQAVKSVAVNVLTGNTSTAASQIRSAVESAQSVISRLTAAAKKATVTAKFGGGGRTIVAMTK